MRVLLDARVSEGGVGRYRRTLLEGLRRAAPEVTVQTLERGHGLERLTRQPLTPWGRTVVRRAMRRLAPDLLHGGHVELPPSVRVPCVVTIFDLIPLEYPASVPSAARRRAYRWILDASLRRAQRIVVPSEATAEALRRHGAATAKVRVVPVGVDPIFRPLTEAERDEARRRFAGGRRYVATSITDRAHKNAPALAAAAARLSSPPRGVPVISTGSPLRRLAPLRFTGALADAELRAFYGGAEAVAVPSVLEGFGFPAAEALACGVPVVCGTGLGALPYLRAGVLVADVHSPASLAEGLRELFDDGPLRERLAEAGREAVAALTAESMAARTAGVYREAIDSFAARRAVG